MMKRFSGPWSLASKRLLRSCTGHTIPSRAILREGQYGSGAGVFPVFEAATPPSFFTFPANYAGTPSLSLPCGRSSRGFPLTIQLQGDRLTEPMLCRIGHAYEQATDWHSSHPDV